MSSWSKSGEHNLPLPVLWWSQFARTMYHVSLYVPQPPDRYRHKPIFAASHFREWKLHSTSHILCHLISNTTFITKIPYSKVHGVNMGPTWVLSAPDGPHVGPMNLAVRDFTMDRLSANLQPPENSIEELVKCSETPLCTRANYVLCHDWRCHVFICLHAIIKYVCASVRMIGINTLDGKSASVANVLYRCVIVYFVWCAM